MFIKMPISINIKLPSHPSLPQILRQLLEHRDELLLTVTNDGKRDRFTVRMRHIVTRLQGRKPKFFILDHPRLIRQLDDALRRAALMLAIAARLQLLLHRLPCLLEAYLEKRHHARRRNRIIGRLLPLDLLEIFQRLEEILCLFHKAKHHPFESLPKAPAAQDHPS